MSVSSFGSKSSSFSMKSQAVIDELQKQRQKDAMEKEELNKQRMKDAYENEQLRIQVAETGNVAWACRLIIFQSEFPKYFYFLFIGDIVFKSWKWLW